MLAFLPLCTACRAVFVFPENFLQEIAGLIRME